MTSSTHAPLWSAAAHRWPTALGLAAAALALSGGAGADAPAVTVCVAVLCYLGAAALDRPWVAWVGVPAGTVAVVVGESAGVAWWAGLAGVALVLLAAGLARGSRPATVRQLVAAVGFGVPAVAAALLLTPQAGLLVAGLVLASHAVWDLVHLRSGRVVPRSLAEFCIALDVPLGLGFVLLALLVG